MKIYLVTVCEKLDKDEYDWPVLGDTRSPGYFPTLEEAIEAVKSNMADIWETCYPYAFIEEITPGFYKNISTSDELKWFKYNKKEKGYEPIVPPIFQHVCGFGPIG